MSRPPEHDKIQLAKDLRAWALLDDSLNLNGFSVKYDIPPQKVTLFAREDENFRSAYQFARASLANRREKKLSCGELHTKAYDLNARVYDQYLKEEHREELEYQSKLKASETKDASPELVNLMTILTERQT